MAVNNIKFSKNTTCQQSYQQADHKHYQI